MHVDPMQPKLKAPGTRRLTLNCDEPLSSFAFKFKSRRYIKDKRLLRMARIPGAGRSVAMHPTQDHVAVGGAPP